MGEEEFDPEAELNATEDKDEQPKKDNEGKAVDDEIKEEAEDSE